MSVISDEELIIDFGNVLGKIRGMALECQLLGR